MNIPTRQIRATYNDKTIRVYQAYNNNIANTALEHGTFISPPFKIDRMTWIKPSFLWMMYRSGWGKKDSCQNRILAIDITREGFDWALKNSLLSHRAKIFANKDEWLKIKKATPVRIQWDPERDLHLQPLEHRAIQIGLTNEAVPLYVNEWIQNITDITPLAFDIHSLVNENKLQNAQDRLPIELPYPLPEYLIKHLDG
ncbi:DUF4291 domain-containing protein [Marinibactrum halimedae]|uniref:DUF4291 domain-containing protein n=1 Tax=Marinibactrum halimedae TaxID=1444977 RepID=A0AA37WL22_9GAMM|nr:DUF4291 domain-containing protein [Marinibactrum halimedae]MCD9460999.1 DUF4291 domain-containing protein [Marinibactrum halimedae]GLS24770.1 hypothetical protein GCM10007877_04840 [Marinibactrum halimedae]